MLHNRRQIRRVLLAGNPYDAFLLEDAGFRPWGQEQPDGAPTFDLVRSAHSAMARLEEGGFDMLMADYDLSDSNGIELVRQVRQRFPQLQVSVITSNTDLGGCSVEDNTQVEPDLFIWYGSPTLLQALIKLKEDELNAPLLAQEEYALVILLVEDEPNFYSHFVPVLYEQIRASALQLARRKKRPGSPWVTIENRPLVLLRRNFEDACEVLYRYNLQLMALITDMRFPVNGELKGEAGLRLLYRARSINGHLPVAVHSREKQHKKAVLEAKARFLWKDSSRLLSHLEQFLIKFCGFGPFVFRWPGGERFGVARNLKELAEQVRTVPDVVFEFHALHLDFSSWLAVHGHQQLAKKVRDLRIRSAHPRQDVHGLILEELDKQA